MIPNEDVIKGSGRQPIEIESPKQTPATLPNEIEQSTVPSTTPAANAAKKTTQEAPASGMPSFTTLKGIAAPLDIANVDTDMIIPKQFLKTIKRTGLGSALFYALRFDPSTNEENPSFVLNQDPYRQAKILVCTGPNFGCGSSREHAPWAFNDFGIRCIIATSFADIFFNNCFKNGMLPLVLSQEQVDQLAVDAKAGSEVEVDLVNQLVKSPHHEFKFDVEPFRKHCLVNGLDDIGLTMQKDEKIGEFEARRTATWPWLDGKNYTGTATKINAHEPKKQKLDW
jgi:3-isopropylmalate dehydratase